MNRATARVLLIVFWPMLRDIAQYGSDEARREAGLFIRDLRAIADDRG